MKNTFLKNVIKAKNLSGRLNTGAIFIILIMGIIIVFAYMLTGGILPTSPPTSILP